MRRHAFRLVWLLVALLGLSITPARAEVIFVADLTNDEEPGVIVPTNSDGTARPISSGEGRFVLNDDETELSMVVTVLNIDVTGTQTPDANDNLIAAHIHAGVLSPAGTAGVRWGFFGSPFNDTLPPSLVMTPFASGVGGVFVSVWNQPEGNGGTNLTAQLPNLFAELAYINFHTVQFGGGEIRGTLRVVPEPGSLALALLCGGLMLLVYGRRRA